MLEIHIVLLPLADLCCRLGKKRECIGKFVRRGLGYSSVGINLHHISTENGRILIPFFPDGSLAAAQGRAVHNVVVDEGEGMEHLQRRGRLEYALVEAVLIY